MSERLRKASFDCGIFTLLYFIVIKLKDSPKEFTEIKHMLKEKVLQFLELNDLQYHARVLKLLIE